MDNSAVQVDDVVDVNEIKVIPVQVRSTSNAQGLRTLKPIVPHTYIYTPEGVLLVHSTCKVKVPPVIIKYQYVSTDFIINFED